MIAVLIGWVSSIPVALHAQAGPASQAGFLALGVAWITTSSLGLLAAINRQFEEHRRWMIRSYALTAAAITLRIMLPISLLFGVPFKYAYPAIAWACWLTNLCLAEYLLKADSGVLAQRQTHNGRSTVSQRQGLSDA
jgi:nucleoside permease NupC